jgi:hypothetical protein
MDALKVFLIIPVPRRHGFARRGVKGCTRRGTKICDVSTMRAEARFPRAAGKAGAARRGRTELDPHHSRYACRPRKARVRARTSDDLVWRHSAMKGQDAAQIRRVGYRCPAGKINVWPIDDADRRASGVRAVARACNLIAGLFQIAYLSKAEEHPSGNDLTAQTPLARKVGLLRRCVTATSVERRRPDENSASHDRS